jgi:hypothetical protein
MPSHESYRFVSSRHCIFCGVTPPLREQLFPRWLTEELQGIRDQNGEIGDSRRPAAWGYTDLDVQVECACKTCNTGWINRLDNTAAPVLTPMLHGRPAVLAESDQSTIAQWATKTAIVIAGTTYGAHPVQEATRRQMLRRNDGPPANVCVAMYAYVGSHRAAWLTYQPINLRSLGTVQGPNFGYLHSVAFNLGHLVARVAIFPGNTTAPPGQDQPLRVPIWPIEGIQTWPPPGLLSDADFDRIHNTGRETEDTQ